MSLLSNFCLTVTSLLNSIRFVEQKNPFLSPIRLWDPCHMVEKLG